MSDNERAELEVAVAELAFWLDFAKWWRQKYCGEEAPRIRELLENAEQRYQRAQRSFDTAEASVLPNQDHPAH
jgi:hypothetical protein